MEIYNAKHKRSPDYLGRCLYAKIRTLQNGSSIGVKKKGSRRSEDRGLDRDRSERMG